MKKSVSTKTQVPIITRSVELIEASHSLTIVEQRLLLLLLSKMSSFGEIRGRWIGVSGLEYIELFGNHGNIYTLIKEAAKSFLKKPIIINKDDGGKEKFTIALGARLPPKTGTIEIEFHREMIPHISNLKKKHTKIKLSQLAGFTSTHALRIYENMLKWKPGTCLEISVEDLKKMLGLYDEKKKKFSYSTFKDFEKDVLKRAKEQINLHTPHFLEYQKVGGYGPKGIYLIKFFLTFKDKAGSKEIYKNLTACLQR